MEAVMKGLDVFMLGVGVAEYVLGGRAGYKNVIAALKQIDAGELTVVETTDELPPTASEEVRRKMPEILRKSRLEERRMTKLLLDLLREKGLA
jgi:hypothetical protein